MGPSHVLTRLQGGQNCDPSFGSQSLRKVCPEKSNGRSGRGRMKSCKRCCAISRIDLRGAISSKIKPQKPLQGPPEKCHFGGPRPLARRTHPRGLRNLKTRKVLRPLRSSVGLLRRPPSRPERTSHLARFQIPRSAWVGSPGEWPGAGCSVTDHDIFESAHCPTIQSLMYYRAQPTC